MTAETPSVCRHGTLRRSCETCDLAEDCERLERDLTAARAQSAALSAERDGALEDSRKWCDDFTKLEPELRRMVGLAEQCAEERDAARARVAELEAGLRQLREAMAEATNTNIVDYINALLEPQPQCNGAPFDNVGGAHYASCQAAASEQKP